MIVFGCVHMHANACTVLTGFQFRNTFCSFPAPPPDNFLVNLVLNRTMELTQSYIQ